MSELGLENLVKGMYFKSCPADLGVIWGHIGSEYFGHQGVKWDQILKYEKKLQLITIVVKRFRSYPRMLTNSKLWWRKILVSFITDRVRIRSTGVILVGNGSGLPIGRPSPVKPGPRDHVDSLDAYFERVLKIFALNDKSLIFKTSKISKFSVHLFWERDCCSRQGQILLLTLRLIDKQTG